jgi:CHASE2 domain-containing sensor protein
VEIVLLWLDDLDDLVFSAALLWERLRRLALTIGLFAAMTMAACELSATATRWIPVLTVVAAASVAAWLAGAVLRAIYYRQNRALPIPA